MNRLAFCIPFLFCTSLFAIDIHPMVKLNGYSSFEYEYAFDNNGNGDPNGSFDADLFDVVLNITPIDRFRIATDLTWEHGSASEDNRGNVGVEYAFAEYSISDWFRVRAGKMFTHFGIYNEIHTAKPAFLTVKEPQSTNKNHKFGSSIRFYPRWGTGLALQGDGVLGGHDVDYIIQLTNGDTTGTTNPYEEDDNSQKALNARFRYAATDSLSLGASIYSDRRDEYDAGGNATQQRTKLLSYGLHGDYTLGNFNFELEYVRGTVDASASSKIERWAYTAMISYLINYKYTPYLRYEALDPDKTVSDDQANLMIIGLNTRINNNLTFKVELDRTSSGSANSKFSGKSFSEVKAALAVRF